MTSSTKSPLPPRDEAHTAAPARQQPTAGAGCRSSARRMRGIRPPGSTRRRVRSTAPVAARSWTAILRACHRVGGRAGRSRWPGRGRARPGPRRLRAARLCAHAPGGGPTGTSQVASGPGGPGRTLTGATGRAPQGRLPGPNPGAGPRVRRSAPTAPIASRSFLTGRRWLPVHVSRRWPLPDRWSGHGGGSAAIAFCKIVSVIRSGRRRRWKRSPGTL